MVPILVKQLQATPIVTEMGVLIPMVMEQAMVTRLGQHRTVPMLFRTIVLNGKIPMAMDMVTIHHLPQTVTDALRHQEHQLKIDLAVQTPTATDTPTPIPRGQSAMVLTPLLLIQHSGLILMVTDTETMLQATTPIHVQQQPAPQQNSTDLVALIPMAMDTLISMMILTMMQLNSKILMVMALVTIPLEITQMLVQL
jgi:hypothetical protein